MNDEGDAVRARGQMVHDDRRRHRDRGPRPAPKPKGKIEVWDKGPDGKARVRQVELP